MATSVPYAGCDRVAARAIMPAASSTAVDPAQVMAWRLPSRALAIVAFLGVALLQGHTRADAGAQRARWNDAALAAAAGPLRALEPRLTGGFAYAPWTSRTPASATPRASSHLLAVAARIEQAADADPRPSHLRALGVARLLIHRPDEALDPLERALTAAPDDPRTLNDLSAALLAQSAASDDTADAVRALDYAERAWRLAPNLPEAAFNAALARERLHLRSEAHKAWTAYQQLDPLSAWTPEAAAHAAALSTDTVAHLWPRVRQDLSQRVAAGTPIETASMALRFPQALREYLQEELLPAWGSAQTDGDAGGAARRLTAAHALCSELADRGDGSCLPTITRIQAAAPDARTALAEAHRTFGRAMVLYREHRLSESRALFDRARAAFAAAGSGEARWCDIHLAIVEYRLGLQETASKRIASLLPRLNAADVALSARAAWLLALGDVAAERFGPALQQYRRAREGFLRARETENVARIDALTAETFAKLGDRRQAWSQYDQALGRLSSGHNVPARQTLLLSPSLRCLEAGFPDAARAFQEEFLFADPPPAEPVAVTEALLHHFASLQGIQEGHRALADLRNARQQLDAVGDLSMRERLEAEIALREGGILAAADPARALTLLARAQELFERFKLQDRLPEILRTRATIEMSTGDEASAQRDLRLGLAALDDRARHLADEPLRASAREQTWPFVVRLIQLELNRRRPVEALRYAEDAKSGDLQPRPPICGAADETSCWTVQVPRDLAVVYYVVLEDRLAIWVITAEGIQPVTHDVAATDLRAMVAQYRRALDERAPLTAVAALSARLFDRLLQPVSAAIATKSQLVIVPDDALHGVPFPALFDARRRRHVVEDHAVLIAPSFAHFLAASARLARSVPHTYASAVVVTSPATSRLVSASLPPLPGADAESREMRAVLPRVQLLSGEQATKAALRTAVADADILHFAGHARANYRAPWRSFLVLAPGGADTGDEWLFVSEMSTLPLARLDLAVLAACGSADGPIAAGSAAISLARPFLAAGVPNVIASLWPVSDRATRRIFTGFYRDLARGRSPAAALRAAQLDMLHGDTEGFRHPAFWAPFVTMGGRGSDPVSK